MYFISLVLFFILISLFSVWGQDIVNLYTYIDIPSLLMILLPIIIMFQTSGYGKEIKKVMKLMIKPATVFERNEYRKMLEGVNLLLKLLLCTGIFALVTGWIMLSINSTAYIEGAKGWLGANIAVSLIPIYYVLILYMIVLPIQAKLKAKLIEEE